ncbi:hypothetical protein [Enterobacter sp. 22325]|uniref:hypothetical protein n=1 Tax=Enterobacter sp. 22325 TaxID=3453911 RepID=UPI003F84FA1E
MRYKYIALLALAVMLIGVFGIYSGDNEDDAEASILSETVDVTYYKAAHDMFPGMLVNNSDFIKTTKKMNKSEVKEWIEGKMIATEQELIVLRNGYGIMQQHLPAEEILSKGMVISLADKIDKELISIPLSVSLESVSNPKVRNADFVDIYLISNDNKIYHEDIYRTNNRGGGAGKDYKDTRVKKFASNVWILKSPSMEGKKKDSRGLSIMNSSDIVEDVEDNNNYRLGEDAAFRKLIYAWFKPEDVDTVIQAQVLGSFFVSPLNINAIPDELSELVIESREVTASDIVSGAPLAERKSKVVEIRGAENATRNN